MMATATKVSARQSERKEQSARNDAVELAKRSFNPPERQQQAVNDRILSKDMEMSQDMTDQPRILHVAVAEGRMQTAQGCSSNEIGKFTCLVRECKNNLCFGGVVELIAHHNAEHPGKRWSDAKCTKLSVVCCATCKLVYMIGASCEHVRRATANAVDIVTAQSIYPVEYWSITVIAVKTDIPTQALQDFNVFLDAVESKVAIACLERGDKENNLHIQAAARIRWNREDGKAMSKYLREKLNLDQYIGIAFKLQCKPFEKGQNWLAMIGYCQKWRSNREYRITQRGMSEEDLKKGRVFLQVYRSDYTKDKFVVDMNNVLKAAYAHWTATRKPVFVTFVELMHDMLQSGDYVVSGKLLSSNPLDRARTEAAWRSLLIPYETTEEVVSEIMFGSKRKPVLGIVSSSRYELDDFCPTDEDAELIQFLQYHLIKRRENVVLVGPAGTGKSCLIETLTSPHGVQFFGTADELKEAADSVQFVVFDDFDFRDFIVDDVKRLLDREFSTQRIKVRYKDASLSNRMTRVILCNTLPALFKDEAVASRTHIKYVTKSLFAETQRKKFRGTHLLDTEEYNDHDNDDTGLFQKLAWGFRQETKESEAADARFETGLHENGNAYTISADSQEQDMNMLRDAALVSP
jgi:hypothetical protein